MSTNQHSTPRHKLFGYIGPGRRDREHPADLSQRDVHLLQEVVYQGPDGEGEHVQSPGVLTGDILYRHILCDHLLQTNKIKYLK